MPLNTSKFCAYPKNSIDDASELEEESGFYNIKPYKYFAIEMLWLAMIVSSAPHRESETWELKVVGLGALQSPAMYTYSKPPNKFSVFNLPLRPICIV